MRKADELSKDRIGTAAPAERDDVVRYKKRQDKDKMPAPARTEIIYMPKEIKKGCLDGHPEFSYKKSNETPQPIHLQNLAAAIHLWGLEPQTH